MGDFGLTKSLCAGTRCGPVPRGQKAVLLSNWANSPCGDQNQSCCRQQFEHSRRFFYDKSLGRNTARAMAMC